MRGAALAALLLTGCLGAPGYQGPVSDHFDGAQFRNPVPKPDKSPVEVVEMLLTRDRPHWQDRTMLGPGRTPPARVGAGALRVTWVSHATVLVQADGLNILTDPNWSATIGPFETFGIPRYAGPGLRFEQLPRIDAVLLSHNHYDHLDLPTLRRLAARDRPRILAGLGTRRHLEQEGVPGAEDLDWWGSARLGDGVRVTAVPAQHWSGRGVGDRRNTLWLGFVVETSAGPVYFAGDTGWGPHFERIRRRFGPMRLALLPIGAYLPRDFMRANHISPGEAVQAARVLEAAVSVPIHWGTFDLGADAQDQPVRALRQALRLVRERAPRFRVPDFGEGMRLARDVLQAGPRAKPRGKRGEDGGDDT